ncbi:MAG: hypothetical protein J3T61_00060 [Candidatus Brocadiales bacterium]|nr:hypothetical protein [Candidatus Bathyanammoxibius sp.]
MTRDHGDASELVAVAELISASRHAAEHALYKTNTAFYSQVADALKAQQAEIERLNNNAQVDDRAADEVHCAIDGFERGNEFEGKSVDVCIEIVGRRAEAAERAVEAARILCAAYPCPAFSIHGALNEAVVAYDKTTATLETREAAETFLGDMGEEIEP